MIRSQIGCEFPGCDASKVECKDGMGFPGWGHIRGLKIDGETRDLHLCSRHLLEVAEFLKENKNGLD